MRTWTLAPILALLAVMATIWVLSWLAQAVTGRVVYNAEARPP